MMPESQPIGPQVSQPVFASYLNTSSRFPHNVTRLARCKLDRVGDASHQKPCKSAPILLNWLPFRFLHGPVHPSRPEGLPPFGPLLCPPSMCGSHADCRAAQMFGSQRYHGRRATGRKTASPAAVLRGEVRLIAATATRLHPPATGELGGVSTAQWRDLRRRLDQRRHARTLRTRFHRNPDAYLAQLEMIACKSTLPA
jgi:hypothetical protein